jgi:hypothetical protein
MSKQSTERSLYDQTFDLPCRALPLLRQAIWLDGYSGWQGQVDRWKKMGVIRLRPPNPTRPPGGCNSGHRGIGDPVTRHCMTDQRGRAGYKPERVRAPQALGPVARVGAGRPARQSYARRRLDAGRPIEHDRLRLDVSGIIPGDWGKAGPGWLVRPL